MTVHRIEVPATQEVIAAWGEHFKEYAQSEGLTSTELSAIAGLKRTQMIQKLKEGLKVGKYIKGMGTRVDSSGRPQRVPVYKLVEPPKPKRKK